MKLDFNHRQSAHCESGVTANLLRHHGLDVSEALAFGIGAGLNFAYLPFVKINKMPLIAFRTTPGTIFKRATRALGATTRSQRFSDPAASEEALDRLLEQSIPVGLQVGVFWLPFFPPALRFHFNAHNLVAYGREGDEYLVSDPTLEEPVRIAAADLRKARFAQGALAPKGRLYYMEKVEQNPDWERAVTKGIRKVCHEMVKVPVPIVGAGGIRFFARRFAKWPDKLGEKRAAYTLGHTVRMLEEIGTGGGGFRFVYAAFLQEAATILGNPSIGELSGEMTSIGDGWREFSLQSTRVCKRRSDWENPFAELSKMLLALADREEKLFRELAKCL